MVDVWKNFSTIFFNVRKKFFGGKNMVSEIKICCRASSVLAGQFWQGNSGRYTPN
jgi:hypothetical protein